jgi:hypothetical protein
LSIEQTAQEVWFSYEAGANPNFVDVAAELSQQKCRFSINYENKGES